MVLIMCASLGSFGGCAEKSDVPIPFSLVTDEIRSRPESSILIEQSDKNFAYIKSATSPKELECLLNEFHDSCCFGKHLAEICDLRTSTSIYDGKYFYNKNLIVYLISEVDKGYCTFIDGVKKQDSKIIVLASRFVSESGYGVSLSTSYLIETSKKDIPSITKVEILVTEYSYLPIN